ncbi:hypothetical protein AW070_24090 [Escherichia coli]|uniref:Uncharacterized protein n=1 Tax=Escherichia coli TaxID=562 RepID=A0A2A2BU30_ECOLX|nr:hypothetical protein AWA97_20915 [Escherichia coli O104:H21 str. CFSAN002236]OTB88317.1 hypothetical protein AW070_24090 [Escherichia coli]PAU13521.1 hypothetical protein BTQ06_25380 [Escherichia coli]PBQ40175.1 hypothetical protein COD56_24230 [Escherichia coli]PBR33356.1 hypothetical protein COD54_24990 [Escherichia coli]
MSGTIRALCHRTHQSSTTRDVALFPSAGPSVNLPVSPPVRRHFVILTDSSFLSYCQSQLFASNRTCVDESAPT